MKIAFALSFYTPYISGLTIHAQRLAEALAERGHDVSIITTQHDKSLPKKETIQKVYVDRVPYLLSLHKGFIMPWYAYYAWKQIKKNDVIVAHLPQLESFVVALIAQLQGKRFYSIYHCDLALPSGVINRIVQASVDVFHIVTLLCSRKIVTYTDDYAKHSRLLRMFLPKVVSNLPPVPVPGKDEDVKRELTKRINKTKNKYVIGIAARFAAEKGVEYVLQAIPRIEEKVGDDFVIVFAGPQHPVGEEAYYQRMKPLLDKYKDQLMFMGTIKPESIGSFYQLLDVLVLPSVNATEAFGLVQVEAMLCGVPVVASDLPGVRVPIQRTGMGEISRPKDSIDIAKKIVSVLQSKSTYIKKKLDIEKEFQYERTIKNYEALFTSVS